MELKNIIQKSGFRFNKRFGQNFIDDNSLLNRIADAASLSKDDVVVEIGVGGGTLTRVLSERCKKVIGYEIDKNLVPVLSQTLSGVENAEVVFHDFMKESVDEVKKIAGDNFTVVANLPYYITSPVVMRLLEEFPCCKRIVVMIQKEVAKRFTAKENTSDYGSITAAIDYYASSKYCFEVGRENFYPVPNVDSAVVRLDRRDKYQVKSERAFKEVLRISFLSRRKTLANNLINVLKIDRPAAESVLEKANIDLSLRGEVLSTAQFISLADVLFERKMLQ